MYSKDFKEQPLEFVNSIREQHLNKYLKDFM